MSATMVKGSAPMEMKKVSISAKRQITIPQKFFAMLGFETEAECMVRGNELVIRPAKTNTGGEFAEQVLADLIGQGYSGNDLLENFKKAQRQVRPAVEAMILEAERVAASESEYASYEDVFGGKEEE
ncbi:AbrB/MazE/SpoVT family DNA-binding domain-containing protein [Acetatifactor aquisgranensis]|jgi:bifunctional DNA-binding transcriptional regulator/antitoxin component of YhaV-PrlF toxin-antitoxin module|uniref:AbrB/MazE/SpoVT family DNA-binding domain-containing protein n=1 Tax=Acetatifactor aquisgranensis TaxID=2941233 RepID=UPI00203D4815|nr:AbrB/MazE/SpoVT family DNA-binding domain-containing protein [Acetatifactor aquisgranensis]